MANKVIAGLGAAALAAGGIVAGTLPSGGGDADGGISDGNAQIAEVAPRYEHQAAQRVFTPDGGRAIRVVGSSKGTKVSDTVAGRLVEVTELDPDAICPAVFTAPEKEEDGKVWPNIPTLDEHLRASGFRPVKIAGSKLGNSWAWHGYVKGQAACEAMTKYKDYLGSSMQEFLALPAPMQRRILRTDGTCKDEEGKDIPCTVPVGDPAAIPEAEIRFPHTLAGRADINFVRAKDGKAKNRYETPDGGFDEVSEEPSPEEI